MISFRYHIVTIVAVFLALAVGLLAGSAFVEPGLVDQLRTQTDRLRDKAAELEGSLTESRADVDALDAFVDAALPYLTQNRLLGRTVVIVAQQGIADAVIGEAERALIQAGANVVAVISARDEIASQDPETQARLGELLGSPGVVAQELPGLAAAALAERLASGGGGGDVEDDLLARLLSEGFLAPVGSGLSEATLELIGSEGQVVLVLGGGEDPDPTVPAETFVVPLVHELVARRMPVAAGESTTTAVSFVDSVRGIDGLVTVDDLDLSMGGAALVLGLEQLLAAGRGGAYGVKDGAEPLPSLP